MPYLSKLSVKRLYVQNKLQAGSLLCNLFAFLFEKLYHSYLAICRLFPTFYFHVYENQKKNPKRKDFSRPLILPACRHAVYFTATTLKNGAHSYIASFGEDPLVIKENLNHTSSRLSSEWCGSGSPNPRRLSKLTTHPLPYYYDRGWLKNTRHLPSFKTSRFKIYIACHALPHTAN